MALRIRALGSLSFSAGAVDVAALLEQPVRAGLLVVLAVERELSRERLLALLWPESDPTHARHALNQTLYLIRRDLGTDLWEADGERLRAAPGLQVDVQEFRSALAAERWEEAVRLCGGEFLDGWYLADARSFEEWVERQRADVRRKLRQAFRGVIQQALDAGEVAHALEVARRWVALDPLEDEAHHRTIELHARLGHRAAALERFDEYRRLLADEDLAPLEETVALVDELRGAAKGPFEVEAREAGPSTATPTLAPASALPRPPLAPSPASPAPPHLGLRRRWVVPTSAAVVLATVLLVPRILGRNAKVALPVPNRILVAPLENATGDPTLDPVGRLAADWILTVLGNDNFLQVVPREVANVPVDVAASGDAGRAAPALAGLGIARANRAGLLISGRYYRSGSGLELHASLIDTETGQVVESFGPVRSDTPDPMEAVGILGQRVRIALAVRLDSRFSGMLNTSTRPPTYEAFRAYADGIASFLRGRWSEAIASLNTAMQLAPDFVDPLTYEGFAYLSAGDPERADSVAAIAYARRSGLTRYDRLRLEILQAMIAGDPRRAYDAAMAGARIQPGGSTQYVAGMEALNLGRPREALEILAGWDPYREGVQPFAPYWNVVTGALHVLQEHGEELRRAREARQRIPDRIEPLWYEARALAALGRTRSLEQVLDASEGVPPTGGMLPGQLMVQAAGELAAHGHEAAAREVARRGVAWLRERTALDPGDTSLRWWMAQALLMAGEEQRAYEIASSLRQEHPDNPDLAGLACALGARVRLPDTARDCARQLTGDRLRDGPGTVTLWRARTSAALGDSDQALGLLQRAFSEGLAFGPWLHADPFLAPLRSLPEFQALASPAG
jgi:DNA-binding SARP family transcriptional activator/TolB-like protein